MIIVLFCRDITYDISVEAVSTLVVFLSCQLFHKEVLRHSTSHKYLMRGQWQVPCQGLYICAFPVIFSCLAIDSVLPHLSTTTPLPLLLVWLVWLLVQLGWTSQILLPAWNCRLFLPTSPLASLFVVLTGPTLKSSFSSPPSPCLTRGFQVYWSVSLFSEEKVTQQLSWHLLSLGELSASAFEAEATGAHWIAPAIPGFCHLLWETCLHNQQAILVHLIMSHQSC